MFRIDRNLVKISPMKVAALIETKESAQELTAITPEEPPDITDPQCEDEAPDAVEPPPSEPEPEIEPEVPELPAGPTPEELAAERAEEIIRQAEEKAAELVKNAAELIESARRDAEELTRVAEEGAEQIRDAAHQSGFEAGAEEARIAAKDELEAKKREDDELLRNVINVIQTERVRMLSEIEGEVVKLTLAVAEKIIKLTAENDDNVFESMIVNALKQMNLEGKLTIRVGVREYDRFFSSGSAVFALGDGTTATAAVIKDSTLAEGDLIIDSDSGAINAGIDSQLRYIELAFNGADSV